MTTKRRVRITCDHDLPVGNCIYVTDVRTGKLIKNITEADIHLKAGDLNKVKLTYIKLDDHGAPIAGKDGKAETETEQVEDAEIDLTVFEAHTRYNLREALDDALTTDEVHHKQWYLWKVAEMLGLNLDIDADRGIAP